MKAYIAVVVAVLTLSALALQSVQSSFCDSGLPGKLQLLLQDVTYSCMVCFELRYIYQKTLWISLCRTKW